ncbi:MAG: hypothetical protein IRY85_14145 [Micromonosporaceae bacterium]|nr:hypothetical protein [Micromonosporaceae bacterium]
MADQLRDEPRIRGGMARLLGATGGGRPGLPAVVIGLAGAAAFVASLLLDWLRVTVESMPELGIYAGEYSYDLSVTGYATSYLIGMLGLLTMVGLALPHPELARRVRLGAVALGIGLAGVLVAIVDEMRDIMRENYGYRAIFFGDPPVGLQEALDRQTYAVLPGQLLAFGAVVLMVAAVWLASGPARSGPGDAAVATASSGLPVADAPSAARGAPAAAPRAGGAPPAGGATPAGPGDEPVDHPSRADAPARVGYVDDLTVVSSDVIDLGGQADILRN